MHLRFWSFQKVDFQYLLDPQYLEYKSYKQLVSIEALSMDDKVKAITIAKKWIVGDKINTDHKWNYF